MTILLDTREILWLVSGDARLPKAVAEAVQNPANEVFLSVVSYWEICVKHSLGKLPLPDSPERYVPLQRDKHRILSSVDSGVSNLHLECGATQWSAFVQSRSLADLALR